MTLEFTEGAPYNRVVLENITFGDSTDYKLEYGCELTKTPKGTQLTKVREVQIIRTVYRESTEGEKELARESVLISAEGQLHTFYFSNPSYGFSAAVEGASGGASAVVVESSAYYAVVKISGASGSVDITVTGNEYSVVQSTVNKVLNQTGRVEMWGNPLISDMSHASDLADWIGDYLLADREYEIQYRGDPRIDANDIAFLENKYVPDLQIRVHDHTLNFNGTLSGTIKARRDMANVAATEN